MASSMVLERSVKIFKFWKELVFLLLIASLGKLDFTRCSECVILNAKVCF